MGSLPNSQSASAFFEQLRKNLQTQGGVRLPVAMGAATILGALWYAALFALEETYVHTLFYERGWIPPLCVWLFFLCLGLLALKSRQISAEAKATESPACRELLRVAAQAMAGDGSAGELAETDPTDSNLVLVRRLRKGAQQLRKGASSSEVGSVLYDQAQADYQIAESSYFLVKFLVWVVPILGFLGTVIGIATAMGDFDSVVTGAANLQGIKAQIGGITDSLSMAFETTLIALVMSALMMLALAVVQKREEDMLATVDQFTVDHLVTAAPSATPAIGGPPRPHAPPQSADLQEVLANLQRIQEAHNQELQRLSSTFEKNAAALDSAAALSETLERNKQIQSRLETALQSFSEVTSLYTQTLRTIYNLGADRPPEG